MSKVFIGVGHGGKDPGATANNSEEKHLTLSIAKVCAAHLERHGVTVKMSRTTDADDPVSEVVRECNAFSPDLAVDIHVNAGGGTGFEAYYYSGGGTSKTLAQKVEARIKAMGRKSRGCKIRKNSSGNDYYSFIRDTKAPAVILETAFIDSSDYQLIDTEAERALYGEAYAKGILDTLGITWTAQGENLAEKVRRYEAILAEIRKLSSI